MTEGDLKGQNKKARTGHGSAASGLFVTIFILWSLGLKLFLKILQWQSCIKSFSELFRKLLFYDLLP